MKTTVNKNYSNTRNARWQYWIILISILFMAITALPNLYQNQTVLEISQTNPQVAPIHATHLAFDLSKNNIATSSVHTNYDTSRIILKSSTDGITAKDIFTKQLGDDFSIKLLEEDSTPKWLKRLGLRPIKLGLDLSGGVLFILDVDSELAFSERLEFIAQTTKSLIREHNIRGARITQNKQQAINLLFPPSANIKVITSEIIKRFPDLLISRPENNKIVLSYSEQAIKQLHQETMQQVLSTMRQRINELGITEAITQRQGHDRIRIELPGVKDPKEAKRIIGATATLDFYEKQNVGGKSFKRTNGEKINVNPIPIFSGKNIKDARAGRDELGIPLVNLTLDEQGGDKMFRFSKRNIGNPLITVFTEYKKNSSNKTEKTSKIINIATIQAQLGARFSITNLASLEEAHELALLIRAGSLTAPVTILKQRTIGPTLGETNIENGMSALMLGVAMTLVFMALWYRRLGLIANCALFLNLLSLLGLMSLLPGAVLTLPGIAGLVLTVGMAVDTNVIIFERIKEERRRGRSLTMAVEHGYKNAFATILDANITTMIAALILYGIGYGPVKGFAMTLGLGLVTSMFTGVFISHVLTNLFYRDTKRQSKSTIKRMGVQS